MKKLFSIVFPVTAALILGTAPAGLAQGTGFYVKGDLGGTISQDVDVEDFFGVNVSGVKLELDPGLRMGIVGGYQVTDWFAAEAEIGFMVNEIGSVKGGWVDDGTISSVPFLVNARFQYPNTRCPFIPYVGAGVGFSESIFDIDYLQIRDVSLSGSDADAVFAWQVFAGIRYTLNDRMGVSVEYRYFDAASPSYEAEFSYGTFDDTFSLGHTRTHAISLAFDYHF